MPPAFYRVFLSRVSSEFGQASSAVASDLRARGLEVKVQEDFTQGPTADTWLARLEEYIRDCDAVVCIHGTRSGGFPAENAIQPFSNLHPPELSRLSFTQWEYFFAKHHRKRIHTYQAASAWTPDAPASAGDDADSQQKFLHYLREHDNRISHPFDSTLKLQNLVLREKWPDHSTAQPSNLPGGYIGQLFLGRDEFLKNIHQSLTGTGHATAITQKSAATGISGLGGIGKTHAAVEYAHRHRGDYTALLFASGDTPEKLNSSLANLCGVLRLDENGTLAPDEPTRVRAALDWLGRNPGWLLIIDNVDDEPAALALTALLGQLTVGHLLITSRLHNWSRQVKNLDLSVLNEDASTDLLLELTADDRRLAADDELQARELAKLLDGLPLAIHQAAGFINEQALTLADYITRYQTKAAELFNWFSTLTIPYAGPDQLGPRPVLITWKTSFEKLTETEQMWLVVFSHFAPDPIPEFLLEPAETTTSGQKKLLRQASNAVAKAAKYCLLTRSRTEATFKIHRLVQQITRFQCGDEDTTLALEMAISLMLITEPGDPTDVPNLLKWNNLQSHSIFLCHQASDDSELTNLFWLLSETGLLLQLKGSYPGAEILLRRALRVSRLNFDPEDPDLAVGCHNLGSLLQVLSQMSEAEDLIREALHINRAAFGKHDERVTGNLNNLARLLQDVGRHEEAEPLMREVLEIDRSIFETNHAIIAADLNNLAGLLQKLGQYEDAEPLMRQALEIDLKTVGASHPFVARDLSNLATLLGDTNRLSEAEPLMREALKIDRVAHGDQHPAVARHLNNLAHLLQATNRIGEAEPLMREALKIDRATYGDNHECVARGFNNLAQLLQTTNRVSEGEPLMRDALRIFMAVCGKDHPNVATSLGNLGLLLQASNRMTEAEPLMRDALRIDSAAFGEDHPSVAIRLNNLAVLLLNSNRLTEAEPLMREALRIDLGTYGSDHPAVARDLNSLATLLQYKGSLTEAESMLRDALRIFTTSLGPEHPHTQTSARNLKFVRKKMKNLPPEVEG
ncbi:MAG: FxSxx-COOH system tetratricopeptide repeat protein [Verrucomicrobiota bacterium]